MPLKPLRAAALALVTLALPLSPAGADGPDRPPAGLPNSLAAQWQPNLVETQDTVNGGAPLRGLVGRVFLFQDLTKAKPITCAGEFVVDLYDDRPLATGGQPVRLERWVISDPVLGQLLRKDAQGWGYTLFLPWVKTYRPEVTHIHLRAAFTRKGGDTLYDSSPSFALPQPNRPRSSSEGKSSASLWWAARAEERPTTPKADALIDALNAQARCVQTLHATDGQVTIKRGLGIIQTMTLPVRLLFQRPHNFRLVAENPFGMVEVDLGANSQEFWLWLRRAEPPLVRLARADLASGKAKWPCPIQPDWLPRVLGLTERAPAKGASVVERPDGFELVEEVDSPQAGKLRWVTLLARSATPPRVTGHRLETLGGKVICTAAVVETQRDPATGLDLPQRVELAWPAENVTVNVRLGKVLVNAPLPGGPAARLFALHTPGPEPAPPAENKPQGQDDLTRVVDLGPLAGRFTVTSARPVRNGESNGIVQIALRLRATKEVETAGLPARVGIFGEDNHLVEVVPLQFAHGFLLRPGESVDALLSVSLSGPPTRISVRPYSAHLTPAARD